MSKWDPSEWCKRGFSPFFLSSNNYEFKPFFFYVDHFQFGVTFFVALFLVSNPMKMWA